MARYSRLTALLAAAAILAAAVPAAASAADPTTQRVYSAFDRGEYIRSVYKDAHVTYSHEPEVTYFTTGREDPPGDTDPVVIDLRSFFAFDVEATDLSISSAVLRINVPNASFVSDDPSETFALVDVTSNLDALLAGGDEGTPGLDGIWDDLGSGHLYASRTFTADDDGTAVEILLDGTAKTMLQAGGRFAFGGHLTTSSNSAAKIEQIFQQSGTNAVHLVLTLVEPPPPPAVHKFDAWIHNGSAAVAGYGVVNGTGSGQKLTILVKQGKSTTFGITITNTGNRTDRYKIRAGASTGAYKIKYKKGSTDITSAVIAGSYLTPKLGAGASMDLTMTVTVTSSAAKGSRITRPVTVTLSSNSASKDVVQAIVKRK